MPAKSASAIIKAINTGQSGYWGELLREMHAGNDRASAILGGVFLDEYLREVLGDFLIEDKKALDDVFGVDRPLGSLSARIKMAYVLGIISKEIYKDFNTIRNVRNVFAHSLSGISFEYPDIKALCQTLITPNHAIPALKDDPDARSMYILSVIIILQYLFLKRSATQKRRCVVPDDIDLIRWKPVESDSEEE